MGDKKDKKQHRPKGGAARERNNQLSKELEVAVHNGNLPGDPRVAIRAKPTNKVLEVPSDVFWGAFRLMAMIAGLPSKVSLVAGIREGKAGYCFIPMGWTPGPSVLARSQDGRIQILEATPDIKEWLPTPTEWMEYRDVPEKLAGPLGDWMALVEGLGGAEPSFWSLGLATQVLEAEVGDDLPDEVVLGTTRFKFRGQDVPFGAVLQADRELKEMRVAEVYNPGNIRGVPPKGITLPTFIIQQGEGPLQKLLHFWSSLLERNFLRYYTPKGARLNRH